MFGQKSPPLPLDKYLLHVTQPVTDYPCQVLVDHKTEPVIVLEQFLQLVAVNDHHRRWPLAYHAHHVAMRFRQRRPAEKTAIILLSFVKYIGSTDLLPGSSIAQLVSRTLAP